MKTSLPSLALALVLAALAVDARASGGFAPAVPSASGDAPAGGASDAVVSPKPATKVRRDAHGELTLEAAWTRLSYGGALFGDGPTVAGRAGLHGRWLAGGGYFRGLFVQLRSGGSLPFAGGGLYGEITPPMVRWLRVDATLGADAFYGHTVLPFQTGETAIFGTDVAAGSHLRVDLFSTAALALFARGGVEVATELHGGKPLWGPSLGLGGAWSAL